MWYTICYLETLKSQRRYASPASFVKQIRYHKLIALILGRIKSQYYCRKMDFEKQGEQEGTTQDSPARKLGSSNPGCPGWGNTQNGRENACGNYTLIKSKNLDQYN